MIKQNRLFEYSYRYRGGKTERKSDREKNDESYRRVRKGDRERVSSIIRLFTSETGCKCYSICLMESLSLLSFLPSSSRVPPRIGIPPNFLFSSFPPPYLLLSSPFHLLFVPFSLYPSLSSFYLVANCFFFLVTRFDQRFPMSSFLRHEEVLSFANPLAVILESREREGKR